MLRSLENNSYLYVPPYSKIVKSNVINLETMRHIVDAADIDIIMI
jgi:hypothetical protein